MTSSSSRERTRATLYRVDIMQCVSSAQFRNTFLKLSRALHHNVTRPRILAHRLSLDTAKDCITTTRGVIRANGSSRELRDRPHHQSVIAGAWLPKSWSSSSSRDSWRSDNMNGTTDYHSFAKRVSSSYLTTSHRRGEKWHRAHHYTVQARGPDVAALLSRAPYLTSRNKYVCARN